MEKKSVILMGIKHCGKSTQGRLLSKYFECPFFDTDDVIHEMTGKSVREIYSQDGKDAFIKAEKDACEYISAASAGKRSVIATGGGICMNPAAVKILSVSGTLVFLNSDEKTAADRIVREIKIDSAGKMSNLPAYISSENPETIDDVRLIFSRFYSERKKLYENLCDVKIDMKDASKAENMRQILSVLEKSEKN